MRLHSFIAATSTIIILGAGCNARMPSSQTPPQQKTSAPSSDQALRTELENVWKGIQASLDQPNGKGYGSFLDLTLYPELTFLKDDSLSTSTIKEIKSTVFYDLSRTTFVGVRQEGDWAGYFFLRNPEDEDGFHRKAATGTVALVLYPFHQVDHAWKMIPSTTESTIQLTTDTEKNQANIQKEFHAMKIKPGRVEEE